MIKYTGTDNLEVMSYATNYNNFLIKLIKKEINEKNKILDFGAGLGYYANILKKESYDINCLELDKQQMKIIKEKRINTYQFLNEIEDESFDFIYSLNVLEHIEDDLKVMIELNKKLKKGGKLFIYVPAFNILYSSMDKKVGHYRRYTLTSLMNLGIKTNMNIEKKSYADSLGFFVTLLFKLIGNKEGRISKRSILFYDKIIFPISKLFDYIFNNFFGKNVYILFTKNH